MRSLTYYYSNTNQSILIQEKIKELCKEKELIFVDICIDGDSYLEQRFGKDAPVILIGPYRINSPFSITEVEVALAATLERDALNPASDDSKSRFQLSGMENFSLWFSKYYVWVISAFITVFIGLAIVTPFLMKGGQTSLANGFYGFYRLLCHQLFYRSFFVEGEQPFYPRRLAGIEGYKTYEEVTGKEANDFSFARNFQGDEILGYKIALCQRDVGIYTSLALAGVIFEITNRKIKPIRWYFWIIIAIIPIGLDGFSQLPGLAEGWPSWLPTRESTPFLRVLTGTLFGLGTGWYVFPLMEESMKEIRFQLNRKKQISLRLMNHK